MVRVGVAGQVVVDACARALRCNRQVTVEGKARCISQLFSRCHARASSNGEQLYVTADEGLLGACHASQMVSWPAGLVSLLP